MTDDELWEIERGLWTMGRAHYERWFSPLCVVALPEPSGLMVGNGFVKRLPEEGGFTSVEIVSPTVIRPTPDTAVLAYAAVGEGSGDARSCVCTSTYARSAQDGRWRLVQHQQTPVSRRA